MPDASSGLLGSPGKEVGEWTHVRVGPAVGHEEQTAARREVPEQHAAALAGDFGAVEVAELLVQDEVARGRHGGADQKRDAWVGELPAFGEVAMEGAGGVSRQKRGCRRADHHLLAAGCGDGLEAAGRWRLLRCAGEVGNVGRVAEPGAVGEQAVEEAHAEHELGLSRGRRREDGNAVGALASLPGEVADAVGLEGLGGCGQVKAEIGEEVRAVEDGVLGELERGVPEGGDEGRGPGIRALVARCGEELVESLRLGEVEHAGGVDGEGACRRGWMSGGVGHGGLDARSVGELAVCEDESARVRVSLAASQKCALRRELRPRGRRSRVWRSCR